MSKPKGKIVVIYTRECYIFVLTKIKCPKCGRIMAGKAPGAKKKHRYIYL